MRHKLLVNTFVLGMWCSTSLFAASVPESYTYTEDKSAILVTSKHPEFVIQLKSNPTTGYSWYLKDARAGWLQPVEHQYIAPKNKKRVGESGYELWTFHVLPAAFKVPQQANLQFVYARPWEQELKPTEKIVTVTTAP